DTVYTPAPLTLQLDGLRIKLPYADFHQKVEDLELQDNIHLRDVAIITPSKMKNYILVKVKRKSEAGIEI
ncbi:MAG: methanogenesis marker 7 protein, partial [Methanomethylovorans sp.]|nr:methanogenesis marker 7 protein [Methanomethylovorans sp.]